jgi:hypothetical protein
MSDAHPGSADQPDDGPAPTYQPTPAGSAPAGQSIRFVEGTIVGINAHHYTVSVKIHGGLGLFAGISYNPLAYIPRLDEEVWVAFVPGPEPGDVGLIWVLGADSWRMFENPTYGRAPSAALWRDSNWPVESGTQHLRPVEMDHKAWDTDHMLIELGDGQTTTMITPQRTGVYTIKAGGRWERDPQAQGRRSMDLRWADQDKPVSGHVIIARDEKAPDSRGECSHSVSADIRITTSIDPAHASPWVRYLGAAVELVVYQTSGQSLSLMADRDPKPFLQMTYQGPMP